MALDFTILSESGEPRKSVSIRPGLHARLVEVAHRHGLGLLASTDDYYCDLDLARKDIKSLQEELSFASRHALNDPALRDVLHQLTKLSKLAECRGVGIAVIAD